MIESNKVRSYGHFARVVGREWRTVSHSYAILLVLSGGIVLYGFLYNLMYAPNLVREVPMVAVDRANNTLSREYLRLFDAAPQAKIVGAAVDLHDARGRMIGGGAEGVVYIPYDFSQRVMRDRQGVSVLFCNTDAFLNFEAVQTAAVGAMMEFNSRLRPATLLFVPVKDRAPIIETVSPSVVGTALFNPTKGYGSYLLPPVLIIIMFQTMLMAVAISCGGEIHSGAIGRYGYACSVWRRTLPIVLGRATVYVLVYGVFALLLLGLLPRVFDLPIMGSGWSVMWMMVPFLLATAFLSQALSIFYSDADAPLLMIAFFSVGLVFLAGVSYPLELMPWYWRVAHALFPAAPAALAFVKIHSMGATLADVQVECWMLWGQCVVYLLLAAGVYRYNIRRALRRPFVVNDTRAPQ